MMHNENDLIPLSALQHFLFCPRQCALIHVERLWEENVFTAEGRILHKKTEQPGHVSRAGCRTVYALPMRSLRLGVYGVADIVEFETVNGTERAFPVEYKRGRPKKHRADEVQLCAQALCLEEMLGREVREGALFYGKTRRRQPVIFDAELRALTEDIAARTRAMISCRKTPPPHYGKHCNNCSLLDPCRPKALTRKGKVSQWLHAQIGEG